MLANADVCNRPYYGPTMNALAAGATNGRADYLRDELFASFAAKDQRGADGFVLRATLLEINVNKR